MTLTVDNLLLKVLVYIRSLISGKKKNSHYALKRQSPNIKTSYFCPDLRYSDQRFLRYDVPLLPRLRERDLNTGRMKTTIQSFADYTNSFLLCF